MTEEEKRIFPTWQPQHYSEFGDPPSTPVRTMAEWEELQGIMITWTDFTFILRQVVDYAQDEGLVYIVCSDSNSVKNYLTAGGVPLTNLKFLVTPFNSIWIRDYGPWTVYSGVSDSIKIIDWIYNRPSRPQDNVIPVFFANYKGYPLYQTTTPPYDLIATGGNFFTDGHDKGFSSKLILNENPSKTEAQIDTIMKKFMGINQYIKFNNLPYDVIHHVDMHMKLLDEETLLVGQYPPGIADGPQIEANLQYLISNFQTCYGRPFKVVRIPMPPHNGIYPHQGGDYRTYTNSIIINKTVIIPTYEFQYDTTAFRIYREAMPGYRIVGVNSNSIIPSLGAIHCIIKEVGVEEPVYISHAKLSGLIPAAEPVEIKAFIKTRSGVASAFVYWTTDTTAGYSSLPMSVASGDTFTAHIPLLPPGTKIYYYILANSISGRWITKPMTAPAGFYHFEFDEPVPVELSSFSASTVGNDVELNWVTASEINNSGFEIERHTERSRSMTSWEKIGFVSGKGTTTEQQFYSFEDGNLLSGKYSYRLKQIDFDGSFEYSNIVEVEVGMPDEFSLLQNFPNPFNPTTKIKFSVPSNVKGETSNVTLKVYDVLGNEVAILVNEEKEPGVYEVEFDGSSISSGVYYYQLKLGSFNRLKKMILIK
jgi:agmatine/peptidylarginine deiminase